MKKLATAIALILTVCALAQAGEEDSNVKELLGRLHREPFHPELICERIASYGQAAMPALKAALKENDSVIHQASQRTIAAIIWKVNPRCFYTLASNLDEIVQLTHTTIIEVTKDRINKLKEQSDLKGLLDIVRSGEPNLARLAIEAVSETGKQATAAANLLGSSGAHDWFYAGALLARSREAVLPEVLKKLRSAGENERAAAAAALTVAPAADAVPTLIKALKHKSSQVRVKIVEALGAAGDKHALETLLKSLKADSDYAVRAQAAWALGLLDESDKTVPALAAALKDSEDLVKSRALESLAVKGGKAAIEALSAFAGDSTQKEASRRPAILALGQTGGQGALEALKPLFGKSGEVYADVPAVLGSLGSVAIPFIRETLNKAKVGDFNTVYRCRLALRSMGAEAVPLLLELLQSQRSTLKLTGRVLLQALTGEDFEFDRAKWEEYLKKNPPK